MDNLVIIDKLCLSKDMGNVKQWANIELCTFYGNILVMILYLLKFAIFNSEKSRDVIDACDQASNEHSQTCVKYDLKDVNY